METAATDPANLAHLEEYADTLISLPHEIQRNLTLIREHDSRVQEVNGKLHEDIGTFMAVQAKSKSLTPEERAALVSRIKTAFLATLTHGEEKVERHLVKLEEDMKCFEEEIRLAGYSQLLVKPRPADNTTRRPSEPPLPPSRAAPEEGRPTRGATRERRRGADTPAPPPPPKRTRRNSVTAASGADATDGDGDDDQDDVGGGIAQRNDKNELSRAERLLRRTRPNYLIEEKNEATETTTNEAHTVPPSRSNEQADQGDDERDDNDAGERGEDAESDDAADRNGLQDDEEERARRMRGPAPPVADSAGGASPNEPLYCHCKRVSFGQMIGCDSRDCAVEWFHYGCVGLKNPPKGKWYCNDCQARVDGSNATGMSTRSRRL